MISRTVGHYSIVEKLGEGGICGTPAPLGSVTMPEIVPRSDWANKIVPDRQSRKVATMTRTASDSFMVPL